MASLMINIVLGGFLVLFAAMAMFPLLMDRPTTISRRTTTHDDQVVRLEHRAVIERRSGTTPPTLAPVDVINDHPSHRSAA